MMLLKRPCPPGWREAVAGYAHSGAPGGTKVTFWQDCDRAPGPWTAVRYAELPPGTAETGHAEGREQVWLVISGGGRAELDDEQHQLQDGDVLTCPVGTACGIRVPETAARPMALLTVEAFPGSPQRRSGPRRVPLAGRISWCAGYRGGGCEQATQVAVAPIDRYLTGRWHRLSLIELEPGGILGDRNAYGGSAGYRRPFNASEIIFTISGAAEITAGDVTAENKDSPDRRLCAGVPPDAAVLVRNLSQEQPLLLASIEMGVPA